MRQDKARDASPSCSKLRNQYSAPSKSPAALNNIAHNMLADIASSFESSFADFHSDLQRRCDFMSVLVWATRYATVSSQRTVFFSRANGALIFLSLTSSVPRPSAVADDASIVVFLGLQLVPMAGQIRRDRVRLLRCCILVLK